MEITDEEFSHDYAGLKRYLLLKSLIPSDIPGEIRKELELNEISAYFEIQKLLLVIDGDLFHDELKKILDANDEVFDRSELECAKFILSRCFILYSKPMHFSFMLVFAFLNHVIIEYFVAYHCYRILYIAEFCIDVLYERLFRKVFKSREYFWRLQLFCEKLEKFFTSDWNLPTLRDTFAGKYWMDHLEECVTDSDFSFSLTESEVEMFEHFYSAERTMNGEESTMSGEREDTENDFEASIYYRSNCDMCGLRCYKYLNYINFLKAVREKYLS